MTSLLGYQKGENMINVSSVTRIHNANSTRIEAMISVFLGNELKNVFPLYIETTSEWDSYFVTDRVDAFVVGILVYAMSNGHDIYCEMPMSGKLKTLLEEGIISDLGDRDSRYYKSQVFADTINGDGDVGKVFKDIEQTFEKRLTDSVDSSILNIGAVDKCVTGGRPFTVLF